MSRTVAFFPRNSKQATFFISVADLLKHKYNINSILIEPVKSIDNINTNIEVFEFEIELKKLWKDIDISYESLKTLEQKYPKFNFMRSLYSEREFNFFPKYFNDSPISYEHQLKYMVGAFKVFENFFQGKSINYIVGELINGLDDSILKCVAESKGADYLSVRQSKMTPGIIICDGYIDTPRGMDKIYQQYLNGNIPEDIKERAIAHIHELRNKITHPSYMEFTKKSFKILTYKKLRSFSKMLLTKDNRLDISLKRLSTAHFAILWNWYKFTNIIKTRFLYNKCFVKKLDSNLKYFVYPLHYEPESSSVVRAFYFSDQIALIKQIAKLLPIGTYLVVKEHGGNHGYRKVNDYIEISYLPNVLLVPRDYNVSSLINKSLGIITLTGRMGWESIVNNKPVIAFGDSYWSSFTGVFNVISWPDLKEKLHYCCSLNGSFKYNQHKLLAFTAAYIACIYEGSFIFHAKKFMSLENIQKFSKMLFKEITKKQ